MIVITNSFCFKVLVDMELGKIQRNKTNFFKKQLKQTINSKHRCTVRFDTENVIPKVY